MEFLRDFFSCRSRNGLIASILMLSVLLLEQSGCGTVYNLATPGGSPSQNVRGRKVEAVPQTAIYGGLRQDLYWAQLGGVGGGGYEAWFLIWELSACLAFDTVLLPITIPKNWR